MTDCGCVGMHDGKTHNQHMDDVYRAMNREMLARGLDESLPPMQRWLALAGFAQEEIARLRFKETWIGKEMS